VGESSRPRNAYCSFCRKSYQDVGPLVEGPGDVYICGECVELCQSIIDQEKRRRRQAGEPGAAVPGAEELERRLEALGFRDRSVREVLSAAMHGHDQPLTGAGRKTSPPIARARALLLIGPAESSRVFVAWALSHLLDVPFARTAATALDRLDSGAWGEEHPLWGLLMASEFNLQAGGRAVLYVEGADRREAQPGLRKLLERPVCTWPADSGRSTRSRIQLDTANLLVVCGGGFTGLDALLARRGRHPEQEVMREDLIAFGMPAAVVQRLPVTVHVGPLGEEALVRIVSRVDLNGLFDRSS
jgi:ATP-dependent Clp protease ATP-binding subunit ClpX